MKPAQCALGRKRQRQPLFASSSCVLLRRRFTFFGLGVHALEARRHLSSFLRGHVLCVSLLCLFVTSRLLYLVMDNNMHTFDEIHDGQKTELSARGAWNLCEPDAADLVGLAI